MSRLVFTTTFLLTVLAVLSACSAEQDASELPLSGAAKISVTEEAPEASEIDLTENFDTDTSIRTLMNAIINPNSTRLWQAVRYVVTLEGVEEDVHPQTDKDWEQLRSIAITLIEGGNALLIPGRVVDNTPLDPDYPDYMYSPKEMQALMESDAEGWRYYIQEMQSSTKATLETIEKRDLLGLIETSAIINNACEGCHAEFWYRRNN